MAEHEYRPGDDVPHSGIYLITHRQHRPSHESLVLKGASFPACKECAQSVRYRLLRDAASLDADPDFTGG